MFEWDDEKHRDNLRKHKLAFEDAEHVFAGACVTFRDRRIDYGEARFLTLGYLEGRLVVVTHTPRGENTRIISMRKANDREQAAHKERLRGLGRDVG